MKLVVIVSLVALVGLLGYLSYVQVSTLNKKIKTLSSNVVDLQEKVKSLQHQAANNISLGTQQQLDTLIHQYEAELNDMQDTNEEHAGHNQECENDECDVEHTDHVMALTGGGGGVDSETHAEEQELFEELQNELHTNMEENSNTSDEDLGEFVNAHDMEDVEDVEDVELVEEDEEVDEEVDVDEEVNVDADVDVDQDVEMEEVDDGVEMEEVDEDVEMEEVDDGVSDIQRDLAEKLHDFYLGKSKNELKKLCETYGKAVTGTKELLVSRLLEVDQLRNSKVLNY